MSDKKSYRKPASIEVVHKPQLTYLKTEVRIESRPLGVTGPSTKLSIADRIRNAVGTPTDLSPKAVRAYLHGLKINLRNLANEVEKLEKRNGNVADVEQQHGTKTPEECICGSEDQPCKPNCIRCQSGRCPLTDPTHCMHALEGE